MNIAVRYYSRSGNTKAAAEAIAKAAGVKALSVDEAGAAISEPVDVLFIGGSLYAYGLDSRLKNYLKTLTKENVKKAVVFSTSWISKHSIDLMKKALAEKGIPVEEEAFYAKNRPDASKLAEAEQFAAKFIK
ncbi:MAG: flavodoxin [Erysipelotrichaceae bacterium]|nr:flavodoxin [Erysipelotrichaceae bacterium]